MSHEQFKATLMRDKAFLKDLYESTSQAKSKRLLYFASDAQLVTLIKFLNLLCNGVIEIKSAHFDALDKRQFSFLRKTLEKKASLQKILQASRKEKLKVLSRFSSTYHLLLYTLFNEI